MFKLGNETNIANINDAVGAANDLYNNQKFLQAIANKKMFDMATCDGTHIVGLIKKHKDYTITVNTYYKRFSRAMAYYNPWEPDQIYINTKFSGRTMESFVATFWHELIHALDGLDENQSFGHGNNSPSGKQNTCPYWVDNTAEFFASQPKAEPMKEPNYNNNESSKIVYKVSFWQRVKNFFGRIF